jgi:hypothetical protein
MLFNSLSLSFPIFEKVSSSILNEKYEVVGLLVFLLESNISLSSLILKDNDIICRFSSDFTSVVLISPDILKDSQHLSSNIPEKIQLQTFLPRRQVKLRHFY